MAPIGCLKMGKACGHMDGACPPLLYIRKQDDSGNMKLSQIYSFFLLIGKRRVSATCHIESLYNFTYCVCVCGHVFLCFQATDLGASEVSKESL